MLRDVDLTLLRAFVVSAERGSMTAAATVLHRTQGAVSQQISRLETALGRTLFLREKYGLSLTPDGEKLIGTARSMLRLNDDIWLNFAGDGLTGTVVLGAPHDLFESTLPVPLKNFTAEYPTVALSLVRGTSAELAEALNDGRVDVALRSEPVGSETGERLLVDELVWVGARDGRAHHTRPVPLCFVSATCAFRAPALHALGDDGLEWNTVFDNASLDATVAMVRMDMAVTPMLRSAVPEDLRILSDIATLPGLPEFAVTLHVAGNAASPAARTLADLISQFFRAKTAVV